MMLKSFRIDFDCSHFKSAISQQLDVLSHIDFHLTYIEYRTLYKELAAFGWFVPEEISFEELKNSPRSLSEADRTCLKYYTKEKINQLFNRIENGIRKKKDLYEVLFLFNERRYKSCAMLTCSLIESELIFLGEIRPVKEARLGRRSGKSTAEAMSNINFLLDGFLLSRFEVLCIVWEYFFKPGKDFNQTLEGELNRNFLMHGMMYKPVRRKTCIKLFSFLDVVIGLRHEIKRQLVLW